MGTMSRLRATLSRLEKGRTDESKGLDATEWTRGYLIALGDVRYGMEMNASQRRDRAASAKIKKVVKDE